MIGVVHNVKADIKIKFRNGAEYTVPVSDGTTSLNNYCRSLDIDEQLYQRSSSNIVGNVCGNTLSLELTSKDKSLVPNFVLSQYYGYMDDTATIDVTLHVNEQDTQEDVFMGTYYVTSWEGGTSSDQDGEISISAVDLFSKIKNMTLKDIHVQRNLSFESYMRTLVRIINNRIPNNMQIQLDEDSVNIYKNSSYDWQICVNNFSLDSIEDLFNNIAKDSIAYIWIDRDNYLRTDHLLDDTIEESVSVLSGSTNLLSYNVKAGDIDKYHGVTVKYINNISYVSGEILSVSNVQLNKGINTLLDQSLSQDNIFSVDLIEVICETGEANSLWFDLYKDTMNLRIFSDTKTICQIKVYGTYIVEDYAYISRYKDSGDQNSVIEVENRSLRSELINTYADGLISLMDMKDTEAEVTGFISPAIRLSDTVKFIGKKFNIDDYYKVTGLKFSISSANYSCTAKLIKVINTLENVNDILQYDIGLLYDCMTGLDINSADLLEITESQNEICESQLGIYLDELRN